MRAALLAAATFVLACGGDDDAALRVDGVRYAEEELLGLDSAARERLALLTGFALAVSDEQLEELGAPRVERERNALLLQRALLERAADAAGLGDEQLAAAYLEQPEERLLVRHLVVLSERWRPPEHRDSARRVAAEALERLRSGADFATIAGRYSDEPGAAARGGLLDPGTRETWVPEFWAAAEALDVGETSGVVETRYGFHVMRLEGRDTIPFGEIRDEVLPRLVAPLVPTGASPTLSDPPGLHVDSAAVRAMAADAFESGPGDAVLARWDGGQLTREASARMLSALPATEFRSATSSSDSLIGRVRQQARRRAVLDEASARGLGLEASEARGVAGAWLQQVEALARSLGMSRGMSDQQVKEVALAALGSTSQSVALARAEVYSLEGLIRRLYAIEVPAAASRSES